MSMYLLGNLAGRLVVAYGLVWLAMLLLVGALKWREAFRRTRRWYGFAAMTGLFLLSLAVAASRGGIA